VNTVAITGPTGTFGQALVPLLERDERVGRLVGIARRPFEPRQHGWAKMVYREGDVRDRGALAEAFAGADVVVHLAFNIYGDASRATLRAINVDGTLNAFHAAVAAGAWRFVYASSVAAYGFHPDNPRGITEDWPTRGSKHLFYSQEKAEVERLLREAARQHRDVELFVLRPTIVLGSHALGAGEELVPAPARALARGLAGLLGRLPVPLPVIPSPQPLQFVHEDDVGQAFWLAILGAGPPGAYNLAGDGVLDGAEVARELGLTPLPVPAAIARAAAAATVRVPVRPAALDWAEAATHPLVVDAARAKRDLGWQPRFTSLEALRDTMRAMG
jgi:nucleoside-diphosphate-sugar epimerase